tara:strand:+ start:205 stop:660 length:456 start_codon:yes stop_codon:yes gene_type:complete
MMRKEIVHNIVKENPGIRFNEIMRLSKIRNGTLSHYVKKLEEERVIDLERTPRVTRLYPTGISKKEAKICKYLTINTQKNIISLILKKKKVTSSQVKEFLEKSPSVVSVSLNELFREKIIEKEYDIPSNKFSLKDPKMVRKIVEEYYPEIQ